MIISLNTNSELLQESCIFLTIYFYRMTKDESTCPIPAKKAKSDETDDRVEDEQSKLDEELLLAAKECLVYSRYRKLNQTRVFHVQKWVSPVYLRVQFGCNET